jgi:tRNA(fMet)-specific endonuclease VapC
MKLRYLLDTNICIYIAKQRPISVLQKFQELSVGEVGMSIITYGELFFGVHKSEHLRKSLHILNELTHIIPPIPMPIQAGECYGNIRASLNAKGIPLGNNDLWIAAHAQAERLILVSNNTREFARVDGLKLENWAA